MPRQGQTDITRVMQTTWKPCQDRRGDGRITQMMNRRGELIDVFDLERYSNGAQLTDRRLYFVRRAAVGGFDAGRWRPAPKYIYEYFGR